jgi:hypothetical protein
VVLTLDLEAATRVGLGNKRTVALALLEQAGRKCLTGGWD